MLVAVIDDDAALREGLALALRDAGHEVSQGQSVADAIRLAERADAIVTDVHLPEGENAGIAIVREVKRRHPTVEVLVMTGHGTIPQAVEAMRLGARNYLQKPFPTATLLRLLGEVELLRGLRQGVSGRGALVGSSTAMRRVYGQIDVAAASDLPVLIRGETGTGKELAARAIHDLSKRKSKPFIAVNCAAIPRELAESELFGHEAGSFTGATAKRTGRFQLAGAGTLFLDEINSLPLEVQPKLLRALETGEIWPVGANKPETSAARVISAANVDPTGLVAAGKFREDLLYRVDVLQAHLPSLRQRVEDIPAIAATILERDQGEGARYELSADALAALLSQAWPGNVRELANVVRRATAVARASASEAVTVIRPEHLDLPNGVPDLPFKEAQERASEEWTRRTVQAALLRAHGNMGKAAALLKMDRSNIYRLVKRLGLPIPAEEDHE
jgi:two-component system NtrC family response regulator